MGSSEQLDNEPVSGRILVVDDHAFDRNTLRAILAKQFDVFTAGSGEEAIATCKATPPDLVFMDIEMPEINGVETCRRLRNFYSGPIVFVTATGDIEEQMQAYDAGGDDIINKPVSADILLRKAKRAIRNHQTYTQLRNEKDSLNRMAMDFLSNMGQSGALLNFMRASIMCHTHEQLGRKLYDTATELGLDANVLIRHDGGPTIINASNQASPIELAIFDNASEMGRIFQFRSRLVVNYSRVSIIIANMPDEALASEEAGRIRDNIAILAETTEALCENVDMRQESMRRAEQLQVAHTGAVEAIEFLRDKYSHMLLDTRLLIEGLNEKVERAYAWLGATQAQEAKLSLEVDTSIQAILKLLAAGGDFDTHFEKVIAALRAGSTQAEIELF